MKGKVRQMNSKCSPGLETDVDFLAIALEALVNPKHGDFCTIQRTLSKRRKTITAPIEPKRCVQGHKAQTSVKESV